MSKKSIYKLKHTIAIIWLINKRIIDSVLENVLGKSITLDISEQEESKIQVVTTEDLGYEFGLESTNFFFIKTKKLLDGLSKEQRERYERDVLAINDIFADERFINAYFNGSHEDVIAVIEEMYFEGKMNAKMLRTIVEIGLLELTLKDHQRFGEIGLLYSWDDPYELQFYSSEEAFKRKNGIK